jgi:hypothetical protein
VTWRREFTRASGIDISGFSVTRNHDRRSREILKRDGPTVIAFQWRTGVIRIGFRDLEGSVNECIRNRETPIRDFPITTGVWAIGARARTGVGRSSLAVSQRQVASEIGESEIPRV